MYEPKLVSNHRISGHVIVMSVEVSTLVVTIANLFYNRHSQVATITLSLATSASYEGLHIHRRRTINTVF